MRVAAAAEAGRRDRARPGQPQHSQPENARLHHQPEGQLLGRPPGHPGRRRLQPGPPDEPQPGRFLQPGIQPGQDDRADRPGPGHDHPEPARLLAGGRAVVDGRGRHREGLRAAGGQELRHPGRRHHVHRAVPAEVLVPQRRGRRRRQPALLAGNDPAGPADHAQRRAGQQRPHRGPGDRRHPGHLRLRRHPHPGSAQEEQRGEGLPGTRLGDRRDDHLRDHRPGGQRQGPPGALPGAEPAVDHQRGVQGRRADAEVAGEPRRLRLRHRGLRPRLPGVAGPDAEPGRGEEAHRAGRRGRPDDHDRHLERGVEHRLRGRRLPAGGRRDRPEGHAQVGLRAGLHQLLHRPLVPQGRRHVPDRQLRRLRGPGRAARHGRAAGRPTRTTTTTATRR